MLALETNVLVRFITRDDEIQADEVDRFLENAAQQGEILFISDTEFCE
ncbi:MAG: type II toxin-antitoxin system VapC family toxin, partial [Calditrichaeota bacterium]|nr:type II toxin-antitoxin system VapC family toxin [Calditrichota bacterium]